MVLSLCSIDCCFTPCLLVVVIHSFKKQTKPWWETIAFTLQWRACPKVLGLYAKPGSETNSEVTLWLLFILLSPEDIGISLILFLLLPGQSSMTIFTYLSLPPFSPAPFYLQMECEGVLILALPRVHANGVWTGNTSKPTLANTTCHHQTLLRTWHSSELSPALSLTLTLILGRHQLTPLISP